MLLYGLSVCFCRRSELVSSRLRSRTADGRVAFLRGHTRGDEDVLTVEGVAKLLQCTIDAVRRIPDSHLRAHQGPGKHLLYLRDEVIAYVRRSSRDGHFFNPSEITDQAASSQPGVVQAGPYFTAMKRKARSVR